MIFFYCLPFSTAQNVHFVSSNQRSGMKQHNSFLFLFLFSFITVKYSDIINNSEDFPMYSCLLHFTLALSLKKKWVWFIENHSFDFSLLRKKQISRFSIRSYSIKCHIWFVLHSMKCIHNLLRILIERTQVSNITSKVHRYYCDCDWKN